MLWAWFGQLSQLPPPAVGVMALITVSGLDIPVPGLGRRVIQSPENTAQRLREVDGKQGIGTGHGLIGDPVFENYIPVPFAI